MIILIKRIIFEMCNFVFAGVSEKLRYLKDLGAKTLWLSGIFHSEAQDDRAILNHTMVNPSVGTMEDLQGLIKTFSKEGQ